MISASKADSGKSENLPVPDSYYIYALHIKKVLKGDTEKCHLKGDTGDPGTKKTLRYD